MKQLILGRHSKSSHNISLIKDIDRPLNEKGYSDAYLMAKFLKKQNTKPDLIVSSPATRAYSTAQIYSNQLELDCEIQINNSLYFNENEYFLHQLVNVPDEINQLMLIGHNPGMHHFAELISGERIIKFPTSAIICIEFITFSWSEINNSEVRMVYFQYPKKLLNI